jgi:chaperonin GroES
MPLRPLGDRVLIKPVKNPDETTSGLVLPEKRTESFLEMQGTVVAVGTPRHPLKEEAEILAGALSSRAVGEGRRMLKDAAFMLLDLVRREPVVNVGDDVLFSWSAGQLISVDDEELLMLRESDILAVIESEPV